jgi:hypothetical protein
MDNSDLLWAGVQGFSNRPIGRLAEMNFGRRVVNMSSTASVSPPFTGIARSVTTESTDENVCCRHGYLLRLLTTRPSRYEFLNHNIILSAWSRSQPLLYSRSRILFFNVYVEHNDPCAISRAGWEQVKGAQGAESCIAACGGLAYILIALGLAANDLCQGPPQQLGVDSAVGSPLPCSSCAEASPAWFAGHEASCVLRLDCY